VSLLARSNWVMQGGKPLLLVFDGGNLHAHEAPLVAPDFSVRWMSTQLQDNNLASQGYWSWMDVRASESPLVAAKWLLSRCCDVHRARDFL